ncbi:regulator of G-protein signaling protein-like isoform X2 [Mytilus trossulus]|uniref:regulator of G-protein signaling protein-like isoform X2 n=1 Tax=Mytilus trossulus TaxID=6551 RepID=UPI003005ABB5
MGILENNDISEDDFVVLLEDRAFVDYFNIYLSLPIFGQHVIYNFIERAFSYEPPIRKKKNLVDRREVVYWLYTKRYPGFSKSTLCTEYMLSSKIRDVNLNLPGKNVDEADDQATLTRNILGNAVGMQLFRESLIGTPGEKCYRCWLDLERHRRMPQGEQRQRLMLYIRNIYLADGAIHELKTAGRHAAFEGKLNFELIPETEIQNQLIEDFGSGNVIYRKNSDDAFQQLQRLILAALRMYWVPRYLLNLLKTVPKQYLAVLKRGTPYDQRALQEQRQMTCNLMFPNIYHADSSPTKLIESNIDGEMKNIRIKPLSARSDKPRTQYTGSSLSDRMSLESCSIPDDGEDVKISDFLSIAGEFKGHVEIIHVCRKESFQEKSGRPGMFTYKKPTIADILDVLYSDFGSLHINKVHPKRHPFLYNLMNKPKIDIENLKVSRQVLLDRPTIIENEPPRNTRLVLRRDGLLIERPSKPRSFMEVLNSALHLDFFRRFMASFKTPYPLAFWKNIEELREMPPGRLRHNMISNIIRKYFSKSAKQGAWLDCSDDIIKQIPSMEKVPLSVLVCAQASVFRAMERKWYPKYLETFPPDADYEPEFIAPTVKEEPKPRVRRVKKKRTLYLWTSFLTTICTFLKSMKDKREVQLLELYMRKEIRREAKRQIDKQNDNPSNKAVNTGSNTQFQTRIVLKNRLVYMDKLPMDLKFWCEVARYVEMVDYIRSLGHFSRDNQDFLYEKAKTIVNYYVASDIPPKNQLNISTDLASHMSYSLEKDGPTRGLFHDALLIIFPLVYHYWRQCQKDWMKNHTAAELMEMIEKEEKAWERPHTPHKYEEVPDYLRVRASQIKVATQFVSGYIIDDDQWIINFSLVDGMRILLPQPKNVTKRDRKGSIAARRTSLMEKGSHKTVTGSDSKMSDSSHKKEKTKDKDKNKLKSKSRKKMDALTEEADSRLSSQTVKPSKSRSSLTPAEGKGKLVDELVERSSNSPSRLRKIDDLVSAAVQEDMDQHLFGTE